MVYNGRGGGGHQPPTTHPVVAVGVAVLVEVVKGMKVVVAFCSHDLILCLDLFAVHECRVTIG